MTRPENGLAASISGTFAERGVSVPFTTPALSGGRIRPSERHGMDVAIPNPSGTRGVYVLPADMLDGYCSMTLHDRALLRRLRACTAITPGNIRQHAQVVAAEGLAGKAVSEAADRAARAERHDMLTMNFALLEELVRFVEGGGAEADAVATDLENRAREAMAKIAPTFGSTPSELHTVLEHLAAILARIGRGAGADQAVLMRRMNRMRAMATALNEWGVPASRPCADQARLVVTVMEPTLVLAREAVAAAQAEASDIMMLLRQHLAQPAALTARLSRAEWLLDGWELICALWDDDSDITPEWKLVEMVALVPLLPREAMGWSEHAPDCEWMEKHCASVQQNVDWRTSAPVFDMIARNEHRRAFAA